MQILRSGVDRMRSTGRSSADEAAAILAEQREKGARLPGFGHRLHTRDPRSTRLLELAAAHGVASTATALARDLADQLGGSVGKAMPLNVDGAIAALLVDLGFDSACGNGFFMMARLPGLVAHVLEEKSREKPMRVIAPTGHAYDGPAPRSPDSG